MKTISKESEILILDAIQDVCDHVNKGTNPTDSVVKVAEDRDLNKNFIRLVCTGYNTGATTYQREKGAGVLEKLADFPIANTEKAIDALYPSKILSPSEKKAATVISDDYLGKQEKQAGYWSELIGSAVNPVNMMGPGHIGMLAAGATPTRDLRDQAEADESMWKNLLIPGVAPYNTFKRLGGSIRGPELKEERRKLEAERDAERSAKKKDKKKKKKRDGDGDGRVNDGTPEEKAAGEKQAMNPTLYHALVGGGIGLTVAGISHFSRKNEEEDKDKKEDKKKKKKRHDKKAIDMKLDYGIEKVSREIPREEQLQHAMNQRGDLQRQVRDLQTKYANSQDILMASLGELGDYFKQANYDWSFEEVDSALSNRYGKAGKIVMDYVFDRNGSEEKRAQDTVYKPVNWEATPFRLAVSAIKQAQTVNSLATEYERFYKEADEKVSELYSPFCQTPASGKVVASVLGKVADDLSDRTPSGRPQLHQEASSQGPGRPQLRTSVPAAVDYPGGTRTAPASPILGPTLPGSSAAVNTAENPLTGTPDDPLPVDRSKLPPKYPGSANTERGPKKSRVPRPPNRVPGRNARDDFLPKTANATPSSVLGRPSSSILKGSADKRASIFSSVIGSSIAGGKGHAAKTTSKIDELAQDLEDPGHTSEMRSIEARTMIQDFLINDEVISGYDPDEVITAYNEISKLSPRVSTQPAIMRPLLRKRLSQGSIEPFEAAEIAEMEKSMRGAVAAPAFRE